MMDNAKLRAFLTSFIKTSNEVAEGSVKIANVFTSKSSESLIGIALFFLTILLTLPLLLVYTTLPSFLILFITIFASLFALVIGILGYKVFTGQTKREIENDISQNTEKRFKSTKTLLEQIQNVDSINQEIFLQQIEDLKQIASTTESINFSEHETDRILQKELLGIILEKEQKKQVVRVLVSELVKNASKETNRQLESKPQVEKLLEEIKEKN